MGGKSHSGESRRIFQNLIADLGWNELFEPV
jgi:hypothetical protein